MPINPVDSYQRLSLDPIGRISRGPERTGAAPSAIPAGNSGDFAAALAQAMGGDSASPAAPGKPEPFVPSSRFDLMYRPGMRLDVRG